MSLPIGSIISSILDPHDFQQMRPHGETWVLANGAQLPAGPLQKLIQNNAYYEAMNPGNVAHSPNLQGVFLRGKNNDRADGRGNAAGDLKVGTYQADDVGPHTHGYRVGYENSTSDSKGKGWNDKTGEHTKDPDPDGDHKREETRPRSVTVNFYLRVA
jgi:hypothetical protein